VSRNRATRRSFSARVNHSRASSLAGFGIENFALARNCMCETAGDRLIAGVFLWRIDENIHRDAHSPEKPTHLRIPLWATEVGFVNDQEVDVTVGTCVAARMGAKQDDLARMDGLHDPICDRIQKLVIYGPCFAHSVLILAHLV
jgi:hypothetical protein